MCCVFTRKKVLTNTREQTCCLTGHRPSKLPWGYNEKDIRCEKFKADLKELLIEIISRGVKWFFTGMAEGFDMIATEILLELREDNSIEIVAVLPCMRQEKLWSVSQQKRYHNILEKCDGLILISKEYTSTCMNERNIYMVDNSSIVVAGYDNLSSGGTRNTITMANKQDLRVVIINTNNYR